MKVQIVKAFRSSVLRVVMRMIDVILLIYQGFGLALPDGKQFSVLHQHLPAAKAANVDHSLWEGDPWTWCDI